MTRRSLFPGLLAALSLLGWAAVPKKPSACKPTPPLRLDAKIVGDPSAPFGITARASSPTGAEVDLEILLPDGVTCLGGEHRTRGRTCDLRMDVQARDRSRREIFVRASYTQDGARVTRVASLILFDAPLPKRIARKNGRGEAVIEFPP